MIMRWWLAVRRYTNARSEARAKNWKKFICFSLQIYSDESRNTGDRAEVIAKMRVRVATAQINRTKKLKKNIDTKHIGFSSLSRIGRETIESNAKFQIQNWIKRKQFFFFLS